MSVETHGQTLEEEESRKREDGVTWIDDFPFEVIEKIAGYLDPKDVLELMMVNKRLYSYYVWDESIAFGRHVDEIQLMENGCKIKKHPDSKEFELDFDLHLHLIKRVTSCDKLWVQMWKWNCEKLVNEAHKTILKRFKSVNQLHLSVRTIIDLLGFLIHFHASVKVLANLEIGFKLFKKDQLFSALISRLLGNFTERQLVDCESIGLTCCYRKPFRVCYQALKKTRAKMILLNRARISCAKWIIKHGIPSERPEAYFLTGFGGLPGNLDVLISFLPKYGVEEIVGEDCVSLIEQATNLWEPALQKETGEYSEFFPPMKVLCFRRKIDLTKDCIYVFRHSYENFLTEFFVCTSLRPQ